MTISPDNKLTIAIVPFYCQAYGVREISDIPHIKAYQYIFAITWFCHSDEYQ